MDGIHDLGGREGFGPIDVDEPEEPFHAPWEARVLGIVRAMSRPPDWSSDWFRHCRELIDPVDYLTRPYYDQWLQTYAAMMINDGLAKVEELASGRAQSPVQGLRPPMPPEQVEAANKSMARFDRDDAPPAQFQVGQAVRAKNHGIPGHTRLPGFVRGRRGTIETCHGAHIVPDASALADPRAEPLYTVSFDASELWPDEPPRRDRVFLDLWERYLDPT